jgi:hypothetical protein
VGLLTELGWIRHESVAWPVQRAGTGQRGSTPRSVGDVDAMLTIEPPVDDLVWSPTARRNVGCQIALREHHPEAAASAGAPGHVHGEQQ